MYEQQFSISCLGNIYPQMYGVQRILLSSCGIKRPPARRSACGHMHFVKNGYRIRDFVDLPIGGKKTIIRMKVQRYKCRNSECTYDQQNGFLSSSVAVVTCIVLHVTL